MNNSTLSDPSTNNNEQDNSSKNKTKIPKSLWREVGELLFIAVILVPMINIFVLQSYAIPSSSMEGELLVGDKLFVSKLHYGSRVPMTPLALPYVHNSIFDSKSYTTVLELPYMRLPGFSPLERGNIVVFNLPTDVKKGFPVDKRTNYVKRCVAAAGEELQIIDGEVLINGEKQAAPERSQFAYMVNTKAGENFNPKSLKKMGVVEVFQGPESYIMMLNEKVAAEVEALPNVSSFEKMIYPAGDFDPRIFPHKSELGWNIDNYGPIYIPKIGDKIALNKDNFAIYETAIRDYENNPSLEWKDDKVYLDGQVIDSYEFKINYYFMMGDNRHNSEDSRYWGFVPEDHVVGKPVFVWLSTEKNSEGWSDWVRWAKSFRIIKS